MDDLSEGRPGPERVEHGGHRVRVRFFGHSTERVEGRRVLAGVAVRAELAQPFRLGGPGLLGDPESGNFDRFVDVYALTPTMRRSPESTRR